MLPNAEDPHEVDGELVELLDRFCEDAELYAEQKALLDSWAAHRDLHRLWQEHLFVLHDQVVVPRLNLGAAKRVFCRNERQKAKLRRLGFIEDRLEIKPWRRLT